jgi:hypothetical protein
MQKIEKLLVRKQLVRVAGGNENLQAAVTPDSLPSKLS